MPNGFFLSCLPPTFMGEEGLDIVCNTAGQETSEFIL